MIEDQSYWTFGDSSLTNVIIGVIEFSWLAEVRAFFIFDDVFLVCFALLAASQHFAPLFIIGAIMGSRGQFINAFSSDGVPEQSLLAGLASHGLIVPEGCFWWASGCVTSSDRRILDTHVGELI